MSRTVSELLPRACRIVLELCDAETIDGAGLGELLAMRARAQARGCTIALAALSVRMQALLELTRVASAFEIYPTTEDALLAGHAHTRFKSHRRPDEPVKLLGCRSFWVFRAAGPLDSRSKR